MSQSPRSAPAPVEEEEDDGLTPEERAELAALEAEEAAMAAREAEEARRREEEERRGLEEEVAAGDAVELEDDEDEEPATGWPASPHSSSPTQS